MFRVDETALRTQRRSMARRANASSSAASGDCNLLRTLILPAAHKGHNRNGSDFIVGIATHPCRSEAPCARREPAVRASLFTRAQPM